MPRREPFLDNHFYHIYNRGVLKNDIFLDKWDKHRFIETLKEFNYQDSLDIIQIRNLNRLSGTKNMARGKQLTDIVCFCLMPNHFHLLLKQRINDGISSFLRKISTGYANYFNQRHGRSGVLFQGRFKSKKIENNAQLVYLSEYIHLNPLKTRKRTQKPSEALREYPWSSYNDFLNKNNNSRLACPGIILDLAGGIKSYKKSIDAWANRKIDTKTFFE